MVEHHQAKNNNRFYLPPPVAPATNRFSLHFPLSITYLTPGIVILVSAMFVAKIHLRVPEGVVPKALFCIF